MGWERWRYMCGQLCEPLRAWGEGLVEGVVVVELPVVDVLDVLVLAVELAAFAIAAPPPTSAPHTVSTVTSGFNRPMDHLLSVGPVGGQRSAVAV